MAISHVGRELRRLVEAEIADVAKELADGSAKTFDAYRELVGFGQGLRRALEILEEIERTN